MGGSRGSDDPVSGHQVSAADVVVAYLRKHAQALAALDSKVRAFEPDAVHQMRVATRRLRATLRTFDSVIGGDETDRLAAELQWLGSVLGAARDAEVQADRMADRPPRAEEVGDRIRAHFAAAGANARDDVKAALDSPRYRELRTALDRVLAEPPLGPRARAEAEQAIPEAVRRSYRKVRRRIRQARRAPAGQDRDVALHQARKAAKQARYAAEAAEPVFSSDAHRFAVRMAAVQSSLGDHQDAVVGRELASELASEAEQAGESAFWYGAWYAVEDQLASHLQELGWRAWRKVSRRRYRRWLDAGRPG